MRLSAALLLFFLLIPNLAYAGEKASTAPEQDDNLSHISPPDIVDLKTSSAYIASLRSKAENGDEKAQRHLGEVYEHGWGSVAQDYAEAYFWFSISGIITDEAEGLTSEQVEAVKTRVAEWYNARAKQGNADAQHCLGWLYFIGRGVRKDYQEAYFWSLLSVLDTKQKHEKIWTVWRDGAAKHLTPEQKAAVKKRAAEWKPTPSPATAPSSK